jgi:hypothetical protein
MNRWFAALIVIASGLTVACLSFWIGARLVPAVECPPCGKSGLCSLAVCLMDFRGHFAAALLIGLAASGLVSLAIKRWRR